MESFDKRFEALKLDKAKLGDDWTPPEVKAILEPWSPHTIDVLKTKIKLSSFDRIYWTDQEWNGKSWEDKIFEGGGYNGGGEIGIINSTNENVSETLYHEVLHAEQPSSQTTTLDKESYAYRIGEEFSIAAGLGGVSSLRSENDEGREFADPKKVQDFVADEYPSVSASAPGEQIVKKSGNKGNVVVERPDGSTYTRMASVGESVPGPMTTVKKKNYAPSVWK
jgi:hypothetical protein